MRDAFVKAICEEAKHNPDLMVLTADLGYTVFEGFEKAYPDQFINVGVAEANMIGVAAGLAAGGKTVIVYSIANFSVLRPFEQIRNDICFPKHNVKIVGVGAGLAYGAAGFSHHALEDVALMRTLPNMTILCPSGPLETRACVKAMLSQQGPVYLRVSKKGEPDLIASESGFKLGSARILRKGSEITFFGHGIVLKNVLQCADLLMTHYRINASVVNVPTIQPLDQDTILKLARKSSLLVSVEEHGIEGGLGTAIAELLAEQTEGHAPLVRCGVRDKFDVIAGNREYLLERSGLLAHQLEERVLETLGVVKD
jgi:transketolase